MKFKALSLFTGAGGMDLGFKLAGVDVIWANEIDKDAGITYETNNPETILRKGDIQNYYKELGDYKNIDIIFGGPPCQGFSIAGKMDPSDIRNNLIWSFLKAIDIVRPKAFVMENVKALLTHKKWQDVRKKFMNSSDEMGYSCYPFLLNSSTFGVPQNRERVFFIGLLDKSIDKQQFLSRLEKYEKSPKSVRETISYLGPAGSKSNPLTCSAKITFAENPILRKSPYAGMLFNGAGRPINLEGASNTLPASMGGNKTPIIDEALLYNQAKDNWIENYHRSLLENRLTPIYKEAPSRLRRITINEAALIQTFPRNYFFSGSKTSVYKQIGNAVPVLLAQAVALATIEELQDTPVIVKNQQLSIDSFITV